MGPLNNEGVAAKTDEHVGQAVSAGARVVAGGARAAGFPTSLYWSPTVLDGVTPDMLIAREETFGPVAPVVEVADDAEALALTNASPYGLLTAVFTADLRRGLRFAEAVRSGWVNVNASTNYWESHLPFGGRAGQPERPGPGGRRDGPRAAERAEDDRLPGLTLRRHPPLRFGWLLLASLGNPSIVVAVRRASRTHRLPCRVIALHVLSLRRAARRRRGGRSRPPPLAAGCCRRSGRRPSRPAS